MDSSIVQEPFSVAPCQTLISRFATFSSPYMVPAEQRDAVRRGRQVERHARGDVLQRHGGGHDGAPQLDVQVACAQPEGEAGEPSGGGELHHSRRCVARHLHQVRRQHPLVRLGVHAAPATRLNTGVQSGFNRAP